VVNPTSLGARDPPQRRGRRRPRRRQRHSRRSSLVQARCQQPVYASALAVFDSRRPLAVPSGQRVTRDAA